MKITIDRKSLQSCLSTISPAIIANPPKPISKCVKIQVTPESVVFTSANPNTMISTETISADIKSDSIGIVAVDFSDLKKIVDMLEFPTLVFETTNDHLKITSQKSEFKLRLHNHEDFPPPITPEGEGIEMNGETFLRMVTQVAPAVSPGDARFVVDAILFDASGGKSLAVGTDSHRVFVAKAMCGDGESYFLVPPAMAIVAGKIFAKNQITIKSNSHCVHFSSGTTFLVTAVKNGQFPNYKDLIKAQDNTTLCYKIKTGEFLLGAQQADLIESEDSKGIKMEFLDSGELRLSRTSIDVGQSEILKPLLNTEATKPFSIASKGKYVIEALESIKTEEATFRASEFNKPFFVSGGDFLAIICPLVL